MTLDELARLLFLTGGITAGLHGNARRAAPSSGALYPIELYPVVHNVEGIEPGVYHYAYREHALEQVRAGDFRAPVVEQGIAQEFLGECGVVLFVTMILQRMRPKYQDRSYRYGLLEAGHVGENAYLAATALGFGTSLFFELTQLVLREVGRVVDLRDVVAPEPARPGRPCAS